MTTKNRAEEATISWRNLPDDVIFEILSWLPPRSLIRFQLVCKSWRSLFSNPNFIQIHINRTTLNSNHNDNHDDDEALIILKNFDSPLSLLRPKKSNSTFNLDPSFPDVTLNCFDVVGSIHGLVCLCLGAPWEPPPRIFVLWNPATKQFKILAPPKIEMDSWIETRSSNGFCFDPRSNDYKIVRTERCSRKLNKSPRVELYSVASDSWREIKVEEQWFNLIDSKSDTIVKGEPYWRAWLDLDNGGAERGVVWFDVGNEAFQQVPKQYMPAFDFTTTCLVNFRGSCALIDSQGLSRLQSTNLHESVTATLWVMEDCFSWSVKFTVKLLLDFRTVTWCSMNGLIVVKHSGGVLALYDPETGDTHNFQIDGSKALHWNSICNYTASLVPIEDPNKLEKKLETDVNRGEKR